jgi:nitrite reductase/ring-hydroxylating ferredoxin subunit
LQSEINNQQFIAIPLSEVAPGTLRQVTIDGQRVCVANTGEGIYAVSDTCTHARVSLSDGYLEGRQVVCPWHGAMFDLKTGRATCGPATDPLRCYRTRVEDASVVVEPTSIASDGATNG